MITPELLAARKSGKFFERILIKAELGEGDVGVWNGTYELTIDGLTYTPINNFEISDLNQTIDGSISDFTITFMSVDASPSDILHNYDWKQKQITVTRLTFPTDSENISDVLGSEILFLGTIDTATPAVPPNGLGSNIAFACQTSAALLDRKSGSHARNQASQALRDPSDKGFEFVTEGNKILEIGQK